MKLLVDMNLSPRWVDVLLDAGFDAVHWSSVCAKNAPDHQVMAWARAHDRLVLTQDLDFSAILAATRCGTPSVVQLRTDDVSPDVIGMQTVAALRQAEAELQTGAVLTLEPARMRLRILPLSPEK